jgi:hypothetical protein
MGLPAPADGDRPCCWRAVDGGLDCSIKKILCPEIELLLQSNLKNDFSGQGRAGWY